MPGGIEIAAGASRRVSFIVVIPRSEESHGDVGTDRAGCASVNWSRVATLAEIYGTLPLPYVAQFIGHTIIESEVRAGWCAPVL